MSKKALIISLGVLLGLLGLIAVGVVFLYSDTDSNGREYVVEDNSQYLLLPAVPTDALVIGCFSDPASVLPSIVSNNGFAAALASSGVKLETMVVSLHFSGKVRPLYVFDAAENGDAIIATAQSSGLHAEAFDCSAITLNRKLDGRKIVLASPSKEVVKSSIRHLKAGESVIKIRDFAMATSQISGDNLLFVSNGNSFNLLPSFLENKYAKSSDFVRRLSDWTAFEVDKLKPELTSLKGKFVSDADEPDIMSIFAECGTSTSEVSSMLPSYTLTAMTMPLKNRGQFIASYDKFLDSKQTLQRKIILRNRLAEKVELSPEDFCERLEVTEVATASFLVAGKLETVNLVQINSVDTELLFAGTGITSLKNYSPGVHPYKYESFIASVFGDLYSLKDEKFFTYINGWIVSGSQVAVGEYAKGHALSYNLKEFMENADLRDLLSDSSASFKAYISLTEDAKALNLFVNKDVLKKFSRLYEGVDYSGIVVTVGEDNEDNEVTVDMFRNEIKRSKAPVAEHNTEIEISRGPFKVKNSRTGRMNSFYQQTDNNYLCLNDENGNGMWAVPFDAPICGAACTIDFLANGKLQILFASGSRLYLIDRLGRFVESCSVDLKKEILLGPAAYDFSGKCKYNVLVLHKDNTIEMYNLEGKIPSSWKTIAPPETVMGLPERLELGGKTFWCVRTSIQTLIYPFGGGQPLTTFKDDEMILPDSKITVKDASSVEVKCYDGKTRTIKLK